MQNRDIEMKLADRKAMRALAKSETAKQRVLAKCKERIGSEETAADILPF